MSLQAARAVIERMKTDEAFHSRVMALQDVAARVRLINAEGFDCTVEELTAVMDELTDDELEAAVGGAPATKPPTQKPIKSDPVVPPETTLCSNVDSTFQTK